MTPGPLVGVRVADFTTNMSGPFGTMILGDQGADVIKIESPGGDALRDIGSGRPGMSGYFANLNRSKRSLVLDLDDPASQPAVDALLDTVDAVVVNYRPGVAARLGLDAATVTADRPALVHVEITGYGVAGPYAGRPAYDHVVQALAGYADLQADRHSGEPALVRQGVVDKATGQALAQAVTAALLARTRTGRGASLTVSMLDVALGFLWPDGMMAHTVADPTTTMPSIANSFRLTRTLDGYLSFTLVTAEQWVRLLQVTGIADDGAISSSEERMRRGGAYMRQVAAVLSQRTTDDAVELLAGAGIPVAPVVALADLHEHPQIVANASIDEFDHPGLGRVRQANPLVRWAGERAGTLRPAPALGEHTAEILAELGVAPVAADEPVEAGRWS